MADLVTNLEDGIIARLKPLVPQADVLSYPDKDFETYEPMHSNGEILVAFAADDYGPPEDTGIVVQERELTYELTFVFSSLRSVGKMGGLYAHLESVRQGLTGWQPAGCSKKTVPVSTDRVKRYKKRWWQYVQTWKLTSLNIEEVEQEADVLLSRITACSGDRRSEITS